MHKRALVVGMILTIGLLALGSPGWAAPQPQARSVITYPTGGTTISGMVEITGIATHPNIVWYDVSYAPGPQPTGASQWVSLANVQSAQVEDGVLAVWDTAGVPDGQYSLALTVIGRDDPTTYQQIVTHLTVNNAQPVPSPMPDTEQPTPEPMPTAVTGPTPTPVSIEQPATPTPRSSPAPEGEEGDGEVTTPSTGESEGEQPAVQFDAKGLRSAFCSGGLITLMLLLLWGLYVLAKASVRWYLRQRTELPWQ